MILRFMYEIESTVRYSDCDESGKLSLTGIVNRFQDCCIAHAESLDIGVKCSFETGGAWLLNNWNIEIIRRPAMDERVVIGTVPYKFTGFFGYRSLVLKTASGEMLAVSDSRWFYYNFLTRSPQRPPEKQWKTYTIEEKVPLSVQKHSRIKSEDGFAGMPAVTVGQSLIDTNHHMNNSRYVEIASDCLENTDEVKSISVEYRTAAKRGDVIIPLVRRTEDETAVLLNSSAGDRYATVIFGK